MPWKTITWKTWRNRLAYLAGSLFLAWHSVAMVLAPVPSDNVIVDTFRSFYHPYLTLTGIDGTWDFFSPIGNSYQYRYTIEDSEGNEHTFKPITEINWFTPTHRWYERILQELASSPDFYGDYFAKFFCRKQAALRPARITLLAVEEAEFWPQDFLLGKNRTVDSEYLKDEVVYQAECPSQ